MRLSDYSSFLQFRASVTYMSSFYLLDISLIQVPACFCLRSFFILPCLKKCICHSEWSGEFGGMQFGGIQARKKTEKNFQYLPFYCCSLSLQPFSHPACTPEGIIFDLRYNPSKGRILHIFLLIIVFANF